jgi:hypothetical protein
VKKTRNLTSESATAPDRRDVGGCRAFEIARAPLGNRHPDICSRVIGILSAENFFNLTIILKIQATASGWAGLGQLCVWLSGIVHSAEAKT